MKKAFWLVLAAALVAPAAFAGGGAEPSIRTANARLKEIVLSGKADAMTTDFYAPGAVLLPPNGPMVTGEENIKALWNGFATMGKVTLDVTADSIQENGDTAIEVGKWTLSAEVAGAPAPVKDNGKYIVIWKRQKDGNWRATHDIWNSDNPPPPAAAK